jgi:hypothetical protein
LNGKHAREIAMNCMSSKTYGKLDVDIVIIYPHGSNKIARQQVRFRKNGEKRKTISQKKARDT